MLIQISYVCQMGGSTTQLAYPSPPPKKKEGATSSKQFSWVAPLRPASEPEVHLSDGMLGVVRFGLP